MKKQGDREWVPSFSRVACDARPAVARRGRVWRATRLNGVFLLLSLLALAPPASAGWFDKDWPFRRTLSIAWDAEHGGDGELAYCEILTAGHVQSDGSDVRVATDDGKVVPAKILRVGPGDELRVLFEMQKNVRNYSVYFGNEKVDPSKKAPAEPEVKYALLLEMKNLQGGKIDSFKDIQQTWEKGKLPIGAIMVERPFIGFNPLGDQEHTISKYSGQIFAPVDGDYQFAASGDDKAALAIDGQPLVFAAGGPGDTRFNGTTHLTRGRHAFLLYHVNVAAVGYVSVGWKPPGAAKWDVIPREAFGVVPRAVPGQLEGFNKTLVADLKRQYLGEFFTAENYAHRVRLNALPGKFDPKFVKYEWDFGDGQKATGDQIDHVFLTDGVYPIRLTMRVNANADTQTFQLPVHRVYDRLNNPQTDDAKDQAGIVAAYDPTAMPKAWLAPSVELLSRSGQTDAMFKFAGALVAEKNIPDPNAGKKALASVVDPALAANRVDDLFKVFDGVAKGSRLQPDVGMAYAKLLIWRSGQFDRAAKALADIGNASDDSKRLSAVALLLANKPTEAKKIVDALPADATPGQRVALSGALARSIEFYIQQNDIPSAEEAWDKWMKRYPGDLFEGYSVLLRVQMLQKQNLNDVAAKVAEAFATAVPDSSYAPTLLDTASKVLAKTDAEKSKALRVTLKKRYPEDPLSQN